MIKIYKPEKEGAWIIQTGSLESLIENRRLPKDLVHGEFDIQEGTLRIDLMSILKVQGSIYFADICNDGKSICRNQIFGYEFNKWAQTHESWFSWLDIYFLQPGDEIHLSPRYNHVFDKRIISSEEVWIVPKSESTYNTSLSLSLNRQQ